MEYYSNVTSKLQFIGKINIAQYKATYIDKNEKSIGFNTADIAEGCGVGKERLV